MTLRSAVALTCVFGLRETVDAGFYELARIIWSAAVDGLEFLSGQFIVMRKKGLNLGEQFGTQVVQRCEMRMTAAAGCDRQQPVVLDPFAVPFPLPCFDNPEQPGGEDATNRSRGVHQHEHIQWIAVVAEGGGTKPKSNGKYIPSGSTAAKRNAP